jgi:hypothetical protein
MSSNVHSWVSITSSKNVVNDFLGDSIPLTYESMEECFVIHRSHCMGVYEGSMRESDIRCNYSKFTLPKCIGIGIHSRECLLFSLQCQAVQVFLAGETWQYRYKWFSVKSLQPKKYIHSGMTERILILYPYNILPYVVLCRCFWLEYDVRVANILM